MRAVVPLKAQALPATFQKAATGQRKKKTSDFEDEDFKVDEEVSSKRKGVKKELGTSANTKPGMKKNALARKIPMSKARASTQETMEFALEPKEVGEGKKRK